MKMIKCYMRFEKLDEIREKLFALGVPGMSVSEVKGIGKPLSQMQSDPDPEKSKVPQFHHRIEISIVLEDESVDEVVDAMVSTLRTGNLGDGKIFILAGGGSHPGAYRGEGHTGLILSFCGLSVLILQTFPHSVHVLDCR